MEEKEDVIGELEWKSLAIQMDGKGKRGRSRIYRGEERGNGVGEYGRPIDAKSEAFRGNVDLESQTEVVDCSLGVKFVMKGSE